MNLGFWINIALLYLYRSGRSTLVVGLMVFSAVATLVFLAAMAVGINDAMIENTVGLYSGHISLDRLPPGVDRHRLQLPGVMSVLERRYYPGRLHGAERWEQIKLVAVQPQQERAHTGLWRKIQTGRYLQPGEATIVVGRPLAERLGLAPGDRVYFDGAAASERVTLHVCGILLTGIDWLDQAAVFCPQSAIAELGDPWAAAVFLQKGVDPNKIITAYRRRLKETADVRLSAWTEQMPDLRQLIDLNYVSMGIVMALVFGIVSLGIACAFIIFILKNLREHGIMKAMGVMPAEFVVLIMAQVVGLTSFAALAGALIGGLAVWLAGLIGIDLAALTSHNRYFSVSGVIYPRLTLFSWAAAPMLAVLCSMTAAVWPASLVVRSKAAQVLRAA